MLRELRDADVPALADLWVAAWQQAMPAIDFAARRAWITAFLRADAVGQRTTVALSAEDQPCGFATVAVDQGYLHQLVVAPTAQGRGIATALLLAAKAGAAGGLTLDVNQANGRAVRFYEREGFAREGSGVNATSGLATWRMRWAP